MIQVEVSILRKKDKFIINASNLIFSAFTALVNFMDSKNKKNSFAFAV